ncbi:MAG TPA: hypothetical protein GX508_04400, partial [Coprothermobacter sp.]|nr:hypothetical protein [Coprothermobacter sp.]
ATDSANQTTTVSFSIRLVEDTKPEIKDVQLQVGATTIAATNGERYTATVPSVPAVGSLTFTVADDQAVSAVAVKVDGATVAVTHVSGNIYTATYSFDASQIDYTVTISTTDSSGQPASMSFKVKLDTPPEIEAVSLKVDDSLDVPLVDGETATLGVRSLGTGTITVKVADDSDTIDGSSSEITVNGELAVKSDEDSTLVATYNFLTATTYHIVVKVVDLAGQVVTFESWVTLVEDEQDPSISNVQLVLAGAETGTTITATDGGEYNVTMPLPTRATITFTATDDVAVYDAWVEVTKDGDSLVKLDVTGNYTATYEFTAAGSYTISIKAKDDVDNVTTYTIQLNLTEDKKPTISDVELSYKGISGQDLSEGLTDAASVDITVSDPTATLTFSATDTIELVEVKVNGATLALTDGSYTKLLTLSSGANRIEITAKDNVGQETTFTCTVNVTIDRFPTISDVTLKLGEESYTLENGETLILSDLPEDGTLNFLISDDVQLTSYEIKVNDVVILGGNTTLKSLSLPLPVTLAESNVIYIKAVDSNNQTVEFRAVVAKNSAPTISNVSIEISGETVSDIASGATLTFIFQEPVNATVSFEAFDDVEVSQVQVLIDETPLTATKVEGTYIATTTFTATGTYTILIEVTDNMGVTST